ncbi:MAG: hypothetical protein KAW02_00015 [candidate division Zixibacteria bacterium]|nr:hypothetical protein [candidate division Zixibacteria bacterium]
MRSKEGFLSETLRDFGPTSFDEYKNATKLDFLGEIKRAGKIIYEK